jgi:hypothetical protein
MNKIIGWGKKVFCLSITIFLFISTAYALEDTTAIIDLIDTGMKHNLSLIQNGRGIVLKKVEQTGSPVPESEIRIEWMFSGTRVRIIQEGMVNNPSSPGESTKQTIQNTGYWNGEFQLHHTFIGDTENAVPVETANFNPRVALPFHPFDEGIALARMTLKEYMAFTENQGAKVLILGKDTCNGIECYAIERQEYFGRETVDHAKIWINPLQGFTLIRSESWINNHPPYYSTDYKITSFPVKDSQETIWYPRYIESKAINPDGSIKTKRITEFHNTELNIGLIQKDIEIVWPSGTLVDDRRKKSDSGNSEVSFFRIDQPASLEEIFAGKVPVDHSITTGPTIIINGTNLDKPPAEQKQQNASSSNFISKFLSPITAIIFMVVVLAIYFAQKFYRRKK